ncbi:hypothetical protein BDV32DRAFT_51484 [Aspergillus pseudonomiae]|uniref:Uncharacterized protein n=1 Tax=Aspergillus pseudonomiae TaxID=1506151 RepID=A0A5N6IFU7_9EURO|nr:uncharacterized protein BDV37DRAFT_295445 [Aspergillus pseudonomiae]KAB8265338.1 hypothetical protein BDV32DRAFT_51484 [Aspergillus pseudonomiae]KAE8402459.1 hypothetical protein BDV37DRAFT_295445 [Aspergillus pseudonomiae]
MDLSRLTRPAILCQCLRCSSSLAALENEWAKLSNSYSVAAGWLSVELHRISISPEKKKIPQSSDLSVLRGRILQEISCKLCQQKIGVLCSLDNGPNVFWKLSKVSFREIVSMRTVEPSFKDGLLERLINPPQKESTRRDRASIQPGALVPVGSSEMDHYTASVEQQIQHHGLSLDHISSSVSNLHDTMSELKGAFTALRIELNGPGRFSDLGNTMNNDFNMITTVLKELKSKSEEIEKLKLEIEALKLKNRYMEEQNTREQQLPSTLAVPAPLPEVRSPGLLQAGRKRPWPDSWPSGRTQPIADSFDDGDEEDSIDFFLEDSHMPPVRIPLKGPETNAVMDTPNDPTAPRSSNFRIEINESRRQSPQWGTPEVHASVEQQTMSKRPRMSQAPEKPPSSVELEKRRPGRPRKSISQATKPDFSQTQTPRPTPLSEQNPNISSNGQKEDAPSSTSPSQRQSGTEARPGRPRSMRSRSRPPPRRSTGLNDSFSEQDQTQTPEGSQQDTPRGAEDPVSFDPETGSGKENPPGKTNGAHTDDGNKREAQEKRKAQVAARDTMARLAMQREEAMETEAR